MDNPKHESIGPSREAAIRASLNEQGRAFAERATPPPEAQAGHAVDAERKAAVKRFDELSAQMEEHRAKFGEDAKYAAMYEEWRDLKSMKYAYDHISRVMREKKADPRDLLATYLEQQATNQAALDKEKEDKPGGSMPTFNLEAQLRDDKHLVLAADLASRTLIEAQEAQAEKAAE